MIHTKHMYIIKDINDCTYGWITDLRELNDYLENKQLKIIASKGDVIICTCIIEKVKGD